MRVQALSASLTLVGALVGCGGEAKPSASAVHLTAAEASAASPTSVAPAATDRAATRATVTEAAPPPKSTTPPGVVRVLVAGDVAPEGRELGSPQRLGDALAPLRSLFGAAHAVVVHEVGVVADPSDGALAPRRAVLTSPAWLNELANAHVAAVAVANGHACDGGRAGVTRTLDRLSDLGVLAVGADAVDPFRPRVLAVNDGHKVCAIAWTSRLRGTECGGGRLAVAHANAARVARAVSEAREACDAVLALGDIDDGATSRAVREVAEAGANAVILRRGARGATVSAGGIEVLTTANRRRVPVFESRGSLVSARGAAKPVGVIADLSFKWDANGRVPALKWGYQLVTTERDGAGRDELLLTRPIDAAADASLVASLTRGGAPKRLFASPCWLSVGPGCL